MQSRFSVILFAAETEGTIESLTRKESGMSHRDRDGHTACSQNAQDLRAVFRWLLQTAQFGAIRFRHDAGWSPEALCVAALLWCWSDEKFLKWRFQSALKIVNQVWRQGVPRQLSRQAFMKMLRRWTGPLVIVLAAALRERMETSLKARFCIAGYVVFGGDGSRLEVARTLSNEARFSPAKSRRKRKSKSRRGRTRRTAMARKQRARHKKADTPQLWLTTLWHAGTGLPWDWRTGPSDSSERQHLLEMIDGLPPNALVTADAGFVGYEFWSALLRKERQFLIRVGSNVRLLKKLGDFRENAGTVYLWPKHAMKAAQPPLVLRLIVVEGGRHPMYLVTSILDKKRLSDQDLAGIYALRWGLELYYRHFKQTFERRKLRSHQADNAECEAHWSMIALWAMLLHAEQYLHRRHVPPKCISVAAVLRAYRTPMREYKSDPDLGESLWQLLANAQTDGYERKHKASRGYPRKKYDPAPGAPRLRNATRSEQTYASKLKGLPA
jgi:Transposase DDE domain